MPHLSSFCLTRPVLDIQPLQPLLDALGLPAPAKPHTTLVYSRALVDWTLPVFTPEESPLTLPLIAPRMESFGTHGEILALVFAQPILAARNAALRRFGAQTDWPAYHPHISLGPTPKAWATRIAHIPLPTQILFGPERRKSV